ncbi:MAG TPA: (Fe-S)-binding protein [Armatimonadota bacterium]|nr:(Fe-S)-binding protein [Armatimonadota bacterium]
MYPIAKSVIFTLLLIAAVVIFAANCLRLYRAMRLGQPENRRGSVVRRIGHLLYYGFLQRRVIAAGGSAHHVFIFWGFLVLMLGNLAFIAGGIHPRLGFDLLGPTAAGVLRASQDIMALVVLFAINYAVFRRWVLRPRHIEPLSPDAFIIIGLIGVLMVAMLLATGIEMATGQLSYSRWTPGANTIGWLTFSYTGLGVWHEALWWLHAVVLLFFLNYLPYSKHLHILAALPNVYLRRRGFVTDLARLDFENSEVFGVAKVTDFTWKQLLDGYACTQCGRCDNNCPAWNTDKPLSPKHIIADAKDNLRRNAPALLAGRRWRDFSPAPAQAEMCEPLIGFKQITPDALWACTTCGACMEQCPVFIEHVPKIVDLRRSLVMMESQFPAELTNFFKEIETNGNPYAMPAGGRTKWAQGLEVPLLRDRPDAEYLYWVGCAGAFDDRNRPASQALVRCLQAAGVSFAILGAEEPCCGDAVRRLGNEYLFEAIARANVELLNGCGVKKIVVTCPHGLNVLKHEYPSFGGHYQVVHHSELLAELLAAGRLPARPDGRARMTLHDSCYLGRYNGIYDAPRAALRRSGAQIVEMPRRRRTSFCCGAGGGRMWMEETLGRRINAERTAEALRTGAPTIAVACPFCLTMLDDGVKDAGADGVVVRDIAQVIAETIAG